MSKMDGGPAFPVEFDDAEGIRCTMGGMTLRDYFAGQVLAGMMACPADASSLDDPSGVAAMLAYRFADRMLTEREKESNND